MLMMAGQKGNNMKINVYNTGRSNKNIVGKNGVAVSRRDLERTALDILTWNEDADFDECCEIVELATIEELIAIIAENQD